VALCTSICWQMFHECQVVFKNVGIHFIQISTNFTAMYITILRWSTPTVLYSITKIIIYSAQREIKVQFEPVVQYQSIYSARIEYNSNSRYGGQNLLNFPPSYWSSPSLKRYSNTCNIHANKLRTPRGAANDSQKQWVHNDNDAKIKADSYISPAHRPIHSSQHSSWWTTSKCQKKVKSWRSLSW